MDHTDAETPYPEEHSERAGTGLEWSDALRYSIRRCARVGEWAILAIIVASVVVTLSTLYNFYVWLDDYSGEFYLLEGDNKQRMWGFITSLTAVGLSLRASWQLRNAMRYLLWGADDYEDSETLAAGFYDLRDGMRWYGYWSIFLLACYTLEAFVF
ncbi:MAG: hypothetical protein IPK76_13540 [Lewinellaceae bacterium]|jgi:hypothetical protein|nr:hypothetical protein [Lewinellaceae bacterium]